MLTAGHARNHIRHTLAGSLGSDISELDVLNMAGRFWGGMHAWQALERRVAILTLGAGETFAVLPNDVQQVQAVYAGDNPRLPVYLGSMEEVQERRGSGVQGLAYTACVRRRTLPVPNLLAQSEALNVSPPWAYTDGTGVVVANAAEDPFTHTISADTVSDSSVIAVSTFTQKVYPAVLADGKYTFTATLRPEPVTGVSPPKSGVLIHSESPLSGGTQTLLEVQWGSTPWSDAPTATIIGTNTGGAQSLTPVAEGEGYWRFTLSGYSYLKAENYGRILCSVQPTRASFASASGTEDVTQTGVVAIARLQLNAGTSTAPYEATGATIQARARLEAVLELDRSPSTTSTTGLQLIYRGSWVDVVNDEDELPIPDYCEPLYIQIARAFARGWEEEDGGALDQRLALIKSGPVFRDAASVDGMTQATFGNMGRGSALKMARASRIAPEFLTDWSSYTGPT